MNNIICTSLITSVLEAFPKTSKIFSENKLFNEVLTRLAKIHMDLCELKFYTERNSFTGTL